MPSEMAIYTLDGAIGDFFDEFPDTTQQECDERAVELVGDPVHPVLIQGVFSYTVTAGPTQDKIVQFRNPSNDLNMDIIDLARNVHPEFVPRCKADEAIGSLSVYVMERLPGITYIMARFDQEGSASEIFQQRQNTIQDFARFFAQSWQNRQDKSPEAVARLQGDCWQDIDLLARALPPRFVETLQQISQNLSSLFSSDYPTVLAHGDLCEMNIIVNPHTHNIIGIIDWAEAEIMTFGSSLWGVFNALGWMGPKGWQFHDRYEDLEKIFWHTFLCMTGSITEVDKQNILLARRLGFFLRYGFQWSVDGVPTPTKDTDSSMIYLDAFLAFDQSACGTMLMNM